MSQPTGVDQAFVAWRHLAHTVRLRERLAERESGLSGAQLFALRQLDREADLSLGELAARTATHASSISVVVARLIEKGLVERHQDPEDKRRAVLRPTEAGRRRLSRAPESADVLLLEAIRRLGDRDRGRLTVLLKGLADMVASPAAFESTTT